MYLDFAVDIPDEPGKISRFKKGGTVYVRYVVGRTYHPDRKYNIPNHKIIGKLPEEGSTVMIPNENYLKYFGDTGFPECKGGITRSSCLRIGTFLIIRKIIEEYHLQTMLAKQLGPRDCGLFLDLAAYSIVCENNAGQYYPDYAYNHPLFTENMHVYSDTKVSGFLGSITDDQRIGFLNEWNSERDHRERIYISYDSTNKNSQAGDIELVEFGHPKDDKGLPIFNYSVGYDTDNEIPLFYEQYPGSIVDVSQLQFMIEKARGYGYRHIGFILDRGYFSKENIQYMDKCGYDFVIMVKGMASFVSGIVDLVRGTFENKRDYSIRQYKVYGITIKHRLYASDVGERYFHIYYSDQKSAAEHEQLEARLERMSKYLDKIKGKSVSISEGYRDYFHLLIYDKDGTFLGYRERKEVIERKLEECGYFVIVTSRKMSARDALELYKSRDVSEKMFRGDKSYLGNKSIRVHTDERVAAKIFIEFVALIIRCRIYTLLQREKEKIDKDPNFMTVPAAIRELEKIEMVKGLDGRYRMDHAVTKNQKVILGAFGMNADSVRKSVKELADMLIRSSEQGKGDESHGQTEKK